MSDIIDFDSEYLDEEDEYIYNDDHIQLLNSTSSLLHEVKKLSSMQDPILRYLSIQSYHLFESILNLHP
mgnify:FL=1